MSGFFFAIQIAGILRYRFILVHSYLIGASTAGGGRWAGPECWGTRRKNRGKLKGFRRISKPKHGA